MGSSTLTPTLLLPHFSDNDKPTFLGDWNDAMGKIDGAHGSLATRVGTLESETGTETTEIAANTAAILTKVDKDSTVVIASDHAVLKDGSDVTAAVATLLTTFAGRVIRFTANNGAPVTYLIDATAHTGVGGSPVGIQMNQPNTHIVLDPGVTLKVKPNASDHYTLIQVTAADCSISGGKLLGDVDTHTGTTGEWGHGIDFNVGADRFKLSGVLVQKMWGDGVIVYGGNNGMIDGVISDSNRRQGMSVINCDSLIVSRSAFINTGQVKFTGPGAGIDIEPNAGTGGVTNLSIANVICANNIGEGVLSSSNGQPITGQVSAVCFGNGNGATKLPGFYFAGSTNKLRLNGCRSSGNGLDGYLADATTLAVKMIDCVASANTRHGFTFAGISGKAIACVADENNQSGFYVDPASSFTHLSACSARANSQLTNITYQNFDVQGTDARLMSCLADAGTLANKPNTGFVVRTTGLRTRLLGCDSQGAYGSGHLTDQTNAAYIDNIIGAPTGQVTVAALAANGTGAPAPVLSATKSRNNKGSFTFGSGTAPTINNQIQVTFSSPYQTVPTVQIVPRNPATIAAGFYIPDGNVTTTGFTIANINALTASQAATVYSLDYVVS